MFKASRTPQKKNRTTRLFGVLLFCGLFTQIATAQTEDLAANNAPIFLNSETIPPAKTIEILHLKNQEIKIQNPNKEIFEYRIYNLKWEKVQSGTLELENTKISYKNLPNEDYILKFTIGKVGRIMHLPKNEF